MKKTAAAVLIFLLGFLPLYAGMSDIESYTVYKQANEHYKNLRFEEAKTNYLRMIQAYPDSKFVPYAYYLLSFLENDTVKVISYLYNIKDRFPNFIYWTNAVEKLGDVYYVLNDHPNAMAAYKQAGTENSWYMLGVIYSADGFQSEAVDAVQKLLTMTTDYKLAYKAFILAAKAYIEMGKLAETYSVLVQAVKLRQYSDDNGARLLFYTGRYYFQRNEVENHFEKALFVFTLLKREYPMSIEATLANNYLSFLTKNNILKAEKVPWIESAFVAPLELAYRDQTITLNDELEQKAEKTAQQAESHAGNVVKTEIVEYIIRIGEYKDLGVANLIVSDIAKTRADIPLGVYFRNDRYYPEIRGITDREKARQYAQKLLSMGYNDTKVVEVVKVVEYNK